MGWQYSPFVIPFVLAGLINLLNARFAWKRRSNTAETAMVFLLLMGSIWTWGHAIELGHFDLQQKAFWIRVAIVGPLLAPAIWLVLILHYTGYEKWLTKRNLIIMFTIPLILLAVAWTNGVNDGHGLYWDYLEVDATKPFSSWGENIRGPFFWIGLAYGNIFVLSGCIFLLVAAIRAPWRFTKQVSAVVLSVFVPVIGHVIYLTALKPIPGYDITSLLFTLSGVILSWHLFRFRILDFLPIAQRTLIDEVGFGALVLDPDDRIVYINPVAKKIFGQAEIEIIGNRLDRVVQSQIDIIQRYKDFKDIRTDISLGQGLNRRVFDVMITPLHEIKRFIGRLVVLQDITERVEVEEKVQQHLQLQVALRAAGTAFSSTLEIKSICHRVAEEMGKVIKATSTHVNGYDLGTSTFTVIAEYISPKANSSESVMEIGQRFTVDDDGNFLRAMQSGQHIISHRDDLDLCEDVKKEMVTYGIQSILYIPLRGRDQIFGYAEIWDTQNHREFTPEEITVCQVLAEQAAVSIENAHSYESVQMAAKDLGLLYKASQILSTELRSVEEIAQIVARMYVEMMPTFSNSDHYPECGIFLFDREEESVRTIAGYYLAEDKKTFKEAAIGKIWSLEGYPIAYRALDTVQPLAVYVDDPEGDPSELGYLEKHELSAVVSLPMAIKGEVIGLIELECYEKKVRFSQEEINLAMTIANQAAVAIENSIAFERVQQAANDLRIVNEASQILSNELLEEEEIANTVARLLVEIMPSFRSAQRFPECEIALYMPENDTLRSIASIIVEDDLTFRDGTIGRVWDCEESPVSSRVLQTLQPVVLRADDPEGDPAEIVYMEKNEIAALIMLPLAVKGKAIGLIELESYNAQADLTDEEIELAMTVANQAAVAIENAQMIKRLQAEHDYSENIIKSAPSLICGIDNDGNTTFANPLVTQITGYQEQELIGENWWKLFYPREEYDQVIHLFKNFEQGDVRDYEMRLTCKDGSKKDILWNSIVIRDNEGDITEIIGFGTDITERKQSEKDLYHANEQLRTQLNEINKLDAALREQAIRDPLTGLFNRRYMDETLEKEIARASRSEEQISIAILDLDHLKDINDTYGHLTGGDKSLRVLADTIKKMCRKGDTVCRYAGDEFLVVLYNAPAKVAYERVLQWKAEISRKVIDTEAGKFKITFSAGVAEYPAHGQSGAEILVHADRALYRAKEIGRDQVVMYNSEQFLKRNTGI